jgi:hypothetical protein
LTGTSGTLGTLGTRNELTRVIIPLPPDLRIRLLIVLLRLAGVFTMTAFLAMLLPVEWMAATHRWIGLGDFPRAPVVDYLTRSIAAFYGFHGGLLLVVSRDPVKYQSIVRYLAFMNVVFGLMLIAIDIHAGMPIFWTITEGPPIIGFGIVIGILLRSVTVEQ